MMTCSHDLIVKNKNYADTKMFLYSINNNMYYILLIQYNY